MFHHYKLILYREYIARFIIFSSVAEYVAQSADASGELLGVCCGGLENIRQARVNSSEQFFFFLSSFLSVACKFTFCNIYRK